MFNFDCSVEENFNNLKNTIEEVKTGSVTYAVRDTEIDGIVIKEGNMLGLVEGKIKEVGEDKKNVASRVLDDMIDAESELITVYYGEDVSDEEASEFENELQNRYGDLDVQFYKGNQPLYYFLMSAE
jgi:dihydroxyacetone kinase-like predicted kinase